VDERFLFFRHDPEASYEAAKRGAKQTHAGFEGTLQRRRRRLRRTQASPSAAPGNSSAPAALHVP
jgi:hypothetical protein